LCRIAQSSACQTPLERARLQAGSDTETGRVASDSLGSRNDADDAYGWQESDNWTSSREVARAIGTFSRRGTISNCSPLVFGTFVGCCGREMASEMVN